MVHFDATQCSVFCCFWLRFTAPRKAQKKRQAKADKEAQREADKEREKLEVPRVHPWLFEVSILVMGHLTVTVWRVFFFVGQKQLEGKQLEGKKDENP